ncbi:MAG: hypothetical protein ACUVQ0_05265 [Thermoproteota archaeon]
MFLTKVKMWPIFGTDFHFSVSVMFGPVISAFLNVYWGTAAIVLARIVGVAVNFYKIKYTSLESALSGWLVFMPIIMGGIYFSKIFKGDKRLIVIPAFSILMFLIHPIGREVWYYSLYWTIPIIIAVFKDKIDSLLGKHMPSIYLSSTIKTYTYSLGSAFTDHAIGSIMYLYLMNISAWAWIQAIPFTIVERAIIAAGITFFYFLIRVSLIVMQRISALAVLTEVSKEKALEKKVEEKE